MIELSVPLQFTPQELYRIGEVLASLRAEGVLILGSGGIVHNLQLAHVEDIHFPVERWAAEFEQWFRDAVQQKKLSELFNYRKAAPHADLAVPTFEHFAPVFVLLGAGWHGGAVSMIYEGFEHGNISMRSFAMHKTTSNPERSNPCFASWFQLPMITPTRWCAWCWA